MNLQEIREYTNTILNRDKLGDPLTGDQFNSMLKVGETAYYESEYKKLIQSGLVLFNNDPLFPFKITSVAATGSLDVPSNYRAVLSAYNKNTNVPIDITTEMDAVRRGAFSMESGERKPYVTFGSTIKVYPSDILCEYIYLRNITNAYYDYCVSEDTELEIYMPVGSSLTRSTIDDSWSLVISGGVVMENIYHNDPLTSLLTTYNSKTVETEFDEMFHHELAQFIINPLAVKEDDQLTTQWSDNKEAQQ